jgi:NAD(P)-dependent dehydrogenase (short-subunit alcohol dehydrogenase family)
LVELSDLTTRLIKVRESVVSVEERLSYVGSKIVIGRVGQPLEISRAILFLADNEVSSYVTD